VAGQNARRLRQPHRRLGHRPARYDHTGAHRAQPCAALTRGAGRVVDLPQRQGAPRQYTALRFTQRLVDAGVAPSTGSTGDSFDNALAENLWSTFKVELMYWAGTTFATRAQAEHALLRYIDGWYNPRRIQASLSGLSPEEYEDAYRRAHHDPAGNEDSGQAGEAQGCTGSCAGSSSSSAVRWPGRRGRTVGHGRCWGSQLTRTRLRLIAHRKDGWLRTELPHQPPQAGSRSSAASRNSVGPHVGSGRVAGRWPVPVRGWFVLPRSMWGCWWLGVRSGSCCARRR
jgi:hypothetical protein